MAYKLLDAAQARWHKVAAPELVPLVRAGAVFIDGKLQERRPTQTEPDATGTGPSQPEHKSSSTTIDNCSAFGRLGPLCVRANPF